MRMLVHSPARLSAKLLLHCNTSRCRPRVYAWYTRPTVAQSKALEFPQKTALNNIFPGGVYATHAFWSWRSCVCGLWPLVTLKLKLKLKTHF